jgi:hypothetical protein
MGKKMIVRKPRKMRMPSNLVGTTFGRWTVLRPALPREGATYYFCRCLCGEERDVLATKLWRGGSRSCGQCIRYTHGGSYESEYASWRLMMQRCYNRNATGFKHYGGRGVRVYAGWMTSDGFRAFVAHIGKRPSKHHSVDRIDSRGHYVPDNVRWATPTQQQRNRRNNRVVAFAGKRQCLAAWAEELGIPRTTLSKRLHRGWSVQRLLTAPIDRRRVAHGR